MSYVAIARKFRPSTFDEIVGQRHVTRTLTNAIDLGRIHHAFLFTGARGVGKTTAARALSQALNCETGATAQPCGTCTSCKEVIAGSSPDVIEIDGASNNSVDDIRDLREQVRYVPKGRYKIYIVDEVHMLSKGAFNALLKTLEEPPRQVVFIFATTEPQKIPDTILSRVQRFDFKRIPISIVSDRLRKICQAEGITIGDDSLRLVARAGDGSMRDAQSLLDQVISYSGDTVEHEQVAQILGLIDRGLLFSMMEGLLEGQPDKCLLAIHQVHEYGYELTEFISEMLELIRNATLVVLSPSSEKYLDVSDDERGRLVELTKGVSPDVLTRSFQVLLDVHEEVARAPRPRLVLEMAVARLMVIRPARPLDDILQQLHQMEQRVRSNGGRARTPAPRRNPSSAEEADEPHPAAAAATLRPSAPAALRPSAPPSKPQPQASVGPNPAASQPHKAPRPPTPSVLRLAPESEETPEAVGAEEEPPPVELAPDPVPIDDSEDAAPAEPPPVPANATVDERFEALLTWLHAGGVRYDLWSEDSVLLAVQGTVLQVGFPTPFKKAQADQLAMDSRILQGRQRYFPEIERMETSLRPGSHAGRTRREAGVIAYEQRVATLRASLEVHPLVQRLRDTMGGRLIAVVPEDMTAPADYEMQRES